MSDVARVVKKMLPHADSHLLDYLSGALDGSPEDFDSPDAIYNAVGDMLMEVSGNDCDEHEVREICMKLFHVLRPTSDLGTREVKTGTLIANGKSDVGRLEAPVQAEGDKLCFVGHDCQTIPKLLRQTYGRTCKHLDLSYNVLTTLKGLEEFLSLEELILDNNELDNTVKLPFNPQLTTLSLNKNKITDLGKLIKMLKQRVPNLEYLSLLGNSACTHQMNDPDFEESDYQRYRYFILHHLPWLKFLDSRVVLNDEREQARKVGHLTRVVKPVMKPMAPGEAEAEYTPLPEHTSPIGMHAGAFGTYTYKYTGRQSEGNRFILNKDL